MIHLSVFLSKSFYNNKPAHFGAAILYDSFDVCIRSKTGKTTKTPTVTNDSFNNDLNILRYQRDLVEL